MFPLLANIEYLGEGGCDVPGNLNTAAVSGYMIHPSGARGDFTLTPTSHGRSGVDYRCDFDPTYSTYSPYYPKVFNTGVDRLVRQAQLRVRRRRAMPPRPAQFRWPINDAPVPSNCS
jgi:hypothetical protein